MKGTLRRAEYDDVRPFIHEFQVDTKLYALLGFYLDVIIIAALFGSSQAIATQEPGPVLRRIVDEEGYV